MKGNKRGKQTLSWFEVQKKKNYSGVWQDDSSKDGEKFLDMKCKKNLQNSVMFGCQEQVMERKASMMTPKFLSQLPGGRGMPYTWVGLHYEHQGGN